MVQVKVTCIIKDLLVLSTIHLYSFLVTTAHVGTIGTLSYHGRKLVKYSSNVYASYQHSLY